MTMNESQTIYTCPMHPDVRQETPGMCPECGMQLIPERKKVQKHEAQGKPFDSAQGKSFDSAQDKHAGHSTNIFKMKFWVSLALSIPIVAYSDIAQKLIGYQAPVFPLSAYMPLVLASVIFFYGGWVFIASAYRELKARLPGMMTLIAIAISTAYLYSVAATFLNTGDTLFWELAKLGSAYFQNGQRY